MEAFAETTNSRPGHRTKRERKIVVFFVIVVVLFLCGRWLWRQVQFSRLRPPLIKAVEAGDTERVRNLLDAGADPDVHLDYQPEPYTWATLLRMLRGDKGVALAQGRTVLMEAVREDRADIVRLLLEHGAAADFRNPPPVPMAPPSRATVLFDGIYYNDLANEQATALHYAIWRGSVESVKALLAHGANVNLQSGNGWTPLFRAIDRWPSIGSSRGRADVEECERLLLEKGADPNRGAVGGRPPLLLAASVPSLSPSVRSVRLLLEHGADPEACDETGRTTLMEAANQREERLAQLLLQAGANINRQNRGGQTALLLAVAGACKDWEGNADFLVARERDRTFIRLLLAHGADVRLSDKTGKTPLQIGLDYHNTEILALLKKAARR